MTSFNEAIDILNRQPVALQTEEIPLPECCGRILAEDILADIPVPPFDTSAMDGYACRRDDLPGPLSLIETIQAGKVPAKEITHGTCAKIMTGAAIPAGADCVIMVENTRVDEQGNIIFSGRDTAANIRFRGEEIQQGNRVMQQGALLRPSHTGLLASMGKDNLKVYKKLHIGVVATGSELVEPGIYPENGKIRNSNSYQLITQIEQTGNIAVYAGIIPDDEALITRAISNSLEQNDVILVSGGVSMGDFDLVPVILEKLGVIFQFQKLAVKPGKPILFGTYRNKYIFGMPGNPVSCFVQFEFLVKPLLYKLMGSTHRPVEMKLPAGERLIRKKQGLRTFLPVKVDDAGKVFPLHYLGSAHIAAMAEADGMAMIPEETEELNQGDLVYVRFF